MLKRAAVTVAAFIVAAVPSTVIAQMYPELSPLIGWPIVIVSLLLAAALAFYGYTDRFPWLLGKPASGPRWITIKSAVDYIRGRSAWKPKHNHGEMWGADLDRDLRHVLGKTFGPRARGREYSLLSSGPRAPLSPVRRIPRSFWHEAQFDPMQIASTPARLVARNEIEKRVFDDIEVERVALEREFPRPSPTVHIPPQPDLKRCFKEDFSSYLKRDGVVAVQDGPVRFDILAQIHEDYVSQSKFVSFYVPHVPGYSHNAAKAACEYLAAHIREIVEGMHDPDGMKIQHQSAGDATWTSQENLKFSGAVFIYYEGTLTLSEMAEIEKRFQDESVSAKLRGASYASMKSLQERTK